MKAGEVNDHIKHGRSIQFMALKRRKRRQRLNREVSNELLNDSWWATKCKWTEKNLFCRAENRGHCFGRGFVVFFFSRDAFFSSLPTMTLQKTSFSIRFGLKIPQHDLHRGSHHLQKRVEPPRMILAVHNETFFPPGKISRRCTNYKVYIFSLPCSARCIFSIISK